MPAEDKLSVGRTLSLDRRASEREHLHYITVSLAASGRLVAFESCILKRLNWTVPSSLNPHSDSKTQVKMFKS